MANIIAAPFAPVTFTAPIGSLVYVDHLRLAGRVLNDAEQYRPARDGYRWVQEIRCDGIEKWRGEVQIERLRPCC